jgi:hypothetical protein
VRAFRTMRPFSGARTAGSKRDIVIDSWLEFRCVHDNIKLGAVNSTLRALLTRGAPILGGGISQVERGLAGRVSLSRYMEVEPWLELRDPGCLDVAIPAILSAALWRFSRH